MTVYGGGAAEPETFPITTFFQGCGIRCNNDEVLVTSKTRQTRRWPVAGGAGCVAGCEADNDEHYQELSAEDTEESAIARSTALWTEFQPTTACCAGIELRASGFTFSWVAAEVKIKVTGTPGRLVNVDVPFGRSSYGTTPSVVSWTDTHQVTIGGDGTAELVLPVPNQRGYSTCAFSAKLSPDQPAQ